MKVINDGSAVSWILATDCVVQYDCTTGIEARCASIPVVSYTPYQRKELMAGLPVAVSQVVHNISDLEDTIRNLRARTRASYEPNPVTSKLLLDYFGGSSGNSAKVISEYIARRLKYIPEIKRGSIYEAKSSVRWLGELRRLWGDYRNKRIDYKFREISAHKIEQRLGVLKEVDELTENLRVKPLSGRVIEITSK